MTTTAGTFSSVHLRERDKLLEEKHAKVLATLERKVERLKRSNVETLKQLFEAQTRGRRLAQSLGFNDIYEAQVSVDTADRETPYRECLERVERLDSELSAEQRKNDQLQVQTRALEQEREDLKSALASADLSCIQSKSDMSERTTSGGRAAQELKVLQVRYDDLLDVKERAAARYKADYAKWRKFSRWLFKEGTDPNEEGISEEEKARREFMNVMRKTKVLAKFGLDSIAGDGSPTPKLPLSGITNFNSDKENELTPIPETRKRRLETPTTTSSTVVGSPNSTSAKPSTGPPSLRKWLYKSVVRNTPPSSSPTLFQDSSMPTSTRQPLTFHSIAQRSPNMRSSLSTSRTSLRATTGPSSDTEDDSQAIGQFLPPIGPFKVSTSPATSPVAMASSQTEPDSQGQSFLGLLTKPMGPPQMGVLRVRPVDVDVVARDAETLQPTKVRRLSVASSSSPPRTSKPTMVDPDRSLKRARDKENEPQAPSSTPANVVTSSAKRLGDYSAFKGRGRYAKEATTNKDTINAQYAIDPSRNGGLNFQYDEVVRSKEGRRHMEAGDCECCRDYYEAVGPLPERLQPPRWRSPSTTPTKACARRNLGSGSKTDPGRRQAEINSHRKAISRHRHHWARAKTPPGYWSIGFPDTQEAAVINERAKEMHEEKRAEVDAAVKEGGRYKKRS